MLKGLREERVNYLTSKSELLQDNFVLPPVGTNILQPIHKEEDCNLYVKEKEQVIV